MKIKWTQIRERNLYGYEATSRDVFVEVVRAYSGDWRIYAKVNGLACKLAPGESLTYSGPAPAKRFAARILSGEIVPEVWP